MTSDDVKYRSYMDHFYVDICFISILIPKFACDFLFVFTLWLNDDKTFTFGVNVFF